MRPTTRSEQWQWQEKIGLKDRKTLDGHQSVYFNRLMDLAQPVEENDAVTKKYVDDHVHAMPNRARGAYDAIVYIDGSKIVADDSNGRRIASGVAGTDDSAVLNALAVLEIQNICIACSLTLTSTVLFEYDNVRIFGSSPPAVNLYDPLVTVNTAIGFQLGSIAAGELMGAEITGLHFNSAAAQTNIAIKIYSYHRVRCDKLNFHQFATDMDVTFSWGSTFSHIHSYSPAHCIQFHALAGPLYCAELDVSAVYVDDGRDFAIVCDNGALEAGLNVRGLKIESFVGAGAGVDFGNNEANSFIGGFIDIPTANYAVKDVGALNTLIGVHIQSGIVSMNHRSKIIGCMFSGGATGHSKLITAGYDCTILGNTFSDITNEVIISMGSAYTDIIANNFRACNCKYYIQISTIYNTVSGNKFSACNYNNAYAGTAYDVYINNGQFDNIIKDNISDSSNVVGSIRFVAGNAINSNIGYLSLTEKSGSSTGTGSEQTIAHGLVSTPTKVAIVPTETGATVSAVWADGTNIYATVTNGKAFNWSAEV